MRAQAASTVQGALLGSRVRRAAKPLLSPFLIAYRIYAQARESVNDMRVKANQNPEHRPTPDPLTLASGSDLSAQPVSNSRGRLSH